MSTRPTPRPALRKAPDRDVHPAEPRSGVVPLHEQAPTADASPATDAAPDGAPAAAPAAAPTAPAPAPRRSVRAALNPRRLVQPAAPEPHDLRRRRGSTTSDALRGSAGDKLVDVSCRIPKSLRKQLRQEAKRRGVSPDELLTLLLRDYLSG